MKIGYIQNQISTTILSHSGDTHGCWRSGASLKSNAAKNIAHKAGAWELAGIEYQVTCGLITIERRSSAGGISDSEGTIANSWKPERIRMLSVKNLYVLKRESHTLNPNQHISSWKYVHSVMYICNRPINIIAKYNLPMEIHTQTMQEGCKWTYKWIKFVYYRTGVYKKDGLDLIGSWFLCTKLSHLSPCIRVINYFFYFQMHSWVGKESTQFSFN